MILHWSISCDLFTVRDQSVSIWMVNGEVECCPELWLIKAREYFTKIGGIESSGE